MGADGVFGSIPCKIQWMGLQVLPDSQRAKRSLEEHQSAQQTMELLNERGTTMIPIRGSVHGARNLQNSLLHANAVEGSLDKDFLGPAGK